MFMISKRQRPHTSTAIYVAVPHDRVTTEDVHKMILHVSGIIPASSKSIILANSDISSLMFIFQFLFRRNQKCGLKRAGAGNTVG